MTALFIFLVFLLVLVDLSSACTLQLSSPNATDRIQVQDVGNVKILDVLINLPASDEALLNDLAGNEWFRPNRLFLTYSSSSEKLLLLRNYYYGLLELLLDVPKRKEQVRARLEPPGCLASLDRGRALNLLRNFAFSGFTTATDNTSAAALNIATVAPTYLTNFNVCTMHIFPFDYTTGLRFHCCKAAPDGATFDCHAVQNDVAVHALNALLLVLTIFLFLFFPLFSPAATDVKTFTFTPKKTREVNVVVTDHPQDYADLGCSTIHLQLLRRVNAFHEQLTKMEPDTLYRLKVGAISFNTDMDRLLPEKKAPFGFFKLVFDTFIQCSNWRSGPMREFCQAPVCGECCCCPSAPWQNFVLSVRTLLVLLVLALPSLPFLYAQVVEDAEHAQIARITYDMGRLPTANIWFGPLAGKILVGVVGGAYLLHCLMYIGVGCNNSDILTYSDLLRNSTVDVSLKSRLAMLKKMVYRTFVPLRRWGLLILPLWLILLVITPVLLLLYTVFTSPIIKMFVYILKMCKKSGCSSRATARSLRNCAKNTFTFIFLCTLVAVFLVIAIGFNFILHALCILVIDFIINLDAALRIFPVVILFVVYTRDVFRRVVNRYLEFHQAIIGRVIQQDEDTVKAVASLHQGVQENTAFVIKCPDFVPQGAAAPTPGDPPAPPPAAPSRPTSPTPSADLDSSVTSVPSDPVKPADLTPFLVRYGVPRVRMRSLALFLDKEDVPYIPRKLLHEMTQMTCPGSPGDLAEALTQALIDLSRIVIFLLLLLVLILAYGDVQFISSGVQFLATVAAGLIPLILRYFFFDHTGALGLETENLRFQMQFAETLNGFRQTWDLKDLIIEEVKNEGCINPVATVKVASKAVTPAPVVAEVTTDEGEDGSREQSHVQAVDMATGREVLIKATDVLEAVEVVTAQGVVVDHSRHAALRSRGAVEGVLVKESGDSSSVTHLNELVTSGTGDKVLARRATEQKFPRKQSLTHTTSVDIAGYEDPQRKVGTLGESTELTEVAISKGVGINTARMVNRANRSRPPSSTRKARLISSSGDPVSQSKSRGDYQAKTNGYSAAMAYDPFEADGKEAKYDPSRETGAAPVKYDPDKADAFDRVAAADDLTAADEEPSEKRQARAEDAEVKVPDLNRKRKEVTRKASQNKKERSKGEALSRLMKVKGLFKVDGKLMNVLKEFSPFGDEPSVSDADVGTGRTSSSLKIDLVVDISRLTGELPREENRFRYLVKQRGSSPPRGDAAFVV